MSIDVIGNFLTIIRNGLKRSKPFIEDSYSKLKYEIAHILKNEGFIQDVEIINPDSVTEKRIKVILKYVNGESVIHDIARKSKPSRRIYRSASATEPVINNLGISILTTNKGIMTNKQARDKNVGGEVICTVW